MKEFPIHVVLLIDPRQKHIRAFYFSRLGCKPSLEERAARLEFMLRGVGQSLEEKKKEGADSRKKARGMC